ncbi:DoxX family protein [Flavobacterium pallidum]|uniref:DoxX family protein n=1 Tax=Flavobacterium pallidum TaxID=2172098 RepID=A0A2S1SGP8_9FLAO|nr:DoxX family protein [Flavobacterium pallidum]AWI25551.1 DoxX family protein [Flavobacterium pallidum]
MAKTIFTWALRIIAAVILLQTLFFKFTAADESVYIFTKLGMEPYGRIGSGIVELFAAILILIPSTTLIGALLSAGVIAGALLSHLFILGIEVKNDGGELFILAVITFICSTILIYMDRDKIPALIRFKT